MAFSPTNSTNARKNWKSIRTRNKTLQPISSAERRMQKSTLVLICFWLDVRACFPNHWTQKFVTCNSANFSNVFKWFVCESFVGVSHQNISESRRKILYPRAVALLSWSGFLSKFSFILGAIQEKLFRIGRRVNPETSVSREKRGGILI